MQKKIIIPILILLIIIVVVAVILITNKKGSDTETKQPTPTTTPEQKQEEEEFTVAYKELAEKQMALPNTGDTIAIIHVKDFGDITVKFFPEVAPKAVENFTTHAKEGYYNGVTFHRVINEFMIQGGDPKGDGTGGESIWGKGFEEELSEALVPYRGSLCMASRGLGKVSLGSQFFITQANANQNMANILRQYGYPEELISTYMKYGGYLSLYMQYTVFGQVIDGMDVVDKIAAVETSQESGTEDRPIEDVVIESIEITNYNK